MAYQYGDEALLVQNQALKTIGDCFSPTIGVQLLVAYPRTSLSEKVLYLFID